MRLVLLFLILLYLIFLSKGLIIVEQLNQTESSNVTGMASTLVQEQIDNLLNTLADDLVWEIEEVEVGYSLTYPVQNMNFTSDASGWIYGEVDPNNVASGSWSSTGGHYDPGAYYMVHDDNDAKINPTSEQWINYSFTINSIPLSAKSFGWYNITLDDDTQYHIEVRLIVPNGTEYIIYVSQTYTVAGSTGWLSWEVDVSQYFTETGTYTYKLYAQTGPAPKNADKPTNTVYWDDVGIELNFSTYKVEVWHNTTITKIPFNINATINFTSTVPKTFKLEIYDWLSQDWNSTFCEEKVIVANSYDFMWCNVTSDLNKFVQNNKTRIRLYSIENNEKGILKEDWVQFFISYQDTEPPRYLYVKDDSNGLVNESSLVNVSVLWNDNLNLSHAILIHNASGTFENVSFCSFSSSLEWCNLTIDTYNQQGKTICWKQIANDTSNNWNTSMPMNCFEVLVPYLEVKLLSPNPSFITYIVQNSTFSVNVSIKCKNGGCDDVYGEILYNSSSDTFSPIPTLQGAQPFFIQETPAYSFKSCFNNPLENEETCSISWLINATGAVGSAWEIKVKVNSSKEIAENFTESAILVISSCTLSFTLNFKILEFGEIFPNTQANPALKNSENFYNITINPESCPLDFYINASDLVNLTFNQVIGAGNLSFNNVSNDYSTSFRLTGEPKLFAKNVLPGNLTLWFWLDVPPVYTGIYLGNITFMGVRSG
jgi:hypothetical protein